MKEHYISLMTLDSEHSKANPLYHLGMALIVRDTETGEETIEDAYGFYSHRKGNIGPAHSGMITYILSLLNWGPFKALIPDLTLENTYSHITQEDVTGVLTHGCTLGRKLPLNAEQLEAFNAAIIQRIDGQREFFKEADIQWLVEETKLSQAEVTKKLESIEQAAADETRDIEAPRMRAVKQSDAYERRIHELLKSSGTQDSKDHWVAVERRRVDQREQYYALHQEDENAPDAFDICFFQEGKNCKTIALNFLMKLFKDCKETVAYLADLLRNKLNRNFPRWTPGNVACLFTPKVDLNEPLYMQETGSRFLAPTMSWEAGNYRVDLSHHEREKRQLNTLKLFLMTMTHEWYQNSDALSQQLGESQIKRMISEADTLLQLKDAGEFSQGYSIFLTSHVDELQLAKQAVAYYQQSTTTVHLPDDITTEFSGIPALAREADRRVNPQPSLFGGVCNFFSSIGRSLHVAPSIQAAPKI